VLSLVIAIRVPVYGQSTVLQTGGWYKVAVENRGVYKITYNDFKKMGFGSGIDPRKIKVFGNAGGMLPQASNISRPVDLTETAIYVAGEADGSFDRGDYILFFAEGPDHVEYDKDRQVFAYENNLYSDKNFYYITISNDDGKRIVNHPQPDGNFAVVDQYDDFVYHEVDHRNILSSGREWVGERFDVNGDRNFTFDVSDIVENSPVKIVSDVMGQSYGASSFDVSWNDALIINQVIPQIPNTQYGVKGIHRRDTVIVNASDVGAPSTSSQTIKYQFNRASSGASTAYLDFFLLNVKRKLRLSGHQTIFRSFESTSQPFSTFAVAGATAECSVWNISQPQTPQRYDYLLEGNVAFFSDPSDILQEYIIFDSEVPVPEFVGTVQNQDLRGLATPNLIIITHPSFLTEAMRLAEHRRHHNQWNAVVVTPEQIYNEFSSGRQDVSAIRDFIKHLYSKNPEALQSVLLMGKGSYDYKDRIEDNTNYVPTYESRNSVSPLATYSSDDFFGFLEDHEGHWGESPVQHHTLDIGVGRLPVKTAAEATNIVDKIIYYDTHKSGYGRWRKEIAFVGDDGNNTDNFTSSHQSQANSMAEAIELSHPGFDAKKIFLGTYVKTMKPNGETIPEASKDVISRFDRGSLIINFTGHGNEKQWTDEKIFSDVEIEELDNKLYPFLVTATCEFGRHDDPAVVSSAELTLLKKEGGSIGLVTTARPVNAGTNFVLNQEFYQSIFEKKSSEFPTLGEVFRNTKNNSTSGVGNRNFSLLADPSMTLAIPSDSVIVTGLHTLSGSDTLKALSTVVIKGEIHDESGRVNDFNGILAFTLFDKEVDFVTIGKNNPAFHYNEWSNAVYRGKATVENGMFEVQFILTKNISSEIGAGKLSLYAHDPETYRDAGGALLSFKIGGTEPEVASDSTPPELQLFMDDTTFVSGGIVSTNSTLIVNLYDESGINISEYDTGKALVAYLDQDDQPFILNDYYEAYTDDFRTGSVHFPVRGLTPGRHSITVKAWDTHNNDGQASIDFMVTDSEDLVIETLGNYPNPFQSETSIFFTHNRSGDDLQAQLVIFNSAGMQLKTYEYEILASSYRVDLGEINDLYDFGKKLPGGLYLARLVVRSLTNGSKNERVTKLIVVN
jgi:hypothetical protein